MSNGKQRDLTPVLPKKERKRFFLLLAFILLLAVSLAAYCNIFYSFNEMGCLIRLSENTRQLISFSVSGIALILCIVGITKKNYSMLAASGSTFLIAAHLSFIFGEYYLDHAFIFILGLCASSLLIPAINERICQLGPRQTSNRRLSFAYCFFFPVFIAFVGLFSLMDHYKKFNLELASQLLSTALILLTLILWISSTRMKLWSSTSTEEKTKSMPCWRSCICTLALLLCHFLILSFLSFSLLHIREGKLENQAIFIALLCLGLFFASYWSKNTRTARILQGTGLCINIILIGATLIVPLSNDNLKVILPIYIFFTPLCLNSFRQVLLAIPSPKNKGWVQLCLLLNFPLAGICGFMIAFIIAFSSSEFCLMPPDSEFEREQLDSIETTRIHGEAK